MPEVNEFFIDLGGQPSPPVHLVQMQSVWNDDVPADQRGKAAYRRLIAQLAESPTKFRAALDKQELAWQDTVKAWIEAARRVPSSGALVLDEADARLKVLFADEWKLYESWRAARPPEGGWQEPS